ncbi:hypothetical protein IV203_030817 [Nitzschia inconspicua]|uniref:Uncharacterized protein n=1 Tax=Nitzschia inconspicua TaxID=303405 RepID=A0A9K3LT32_9STRA|nr:hypothetical protein IV203_030817 [Nitzschia inconspicua]
MLNVIVAFFVETFMTQLNLVDVEDEILAGRCNPLSFDATELHKTDIVSTNCSVTGEALRFDVIQREGYDEIMESVANQNNDQSETFAKSLRDTMENLATMSATSDRTGHLICCRQSMSQFSTESFQRLVGEYLRHDKMQTVLLEMLEQMSDFDSRPISAWSFEYQGVAQQHSHPSDSTRFLFLRGMVLPNNPSIAVLTAEVISAYS